MIDRKLRKERVSTRQRFRSMLHGDADPDCDPVPWYRLRRNYLPLLMIGIFFILRFVLKALNLDEADPEDLPLIQIEEQE